jgi:hypothetical protein
LKVSNSESIEAAASAVCTWASFACCIAWSRSLKRGFSGPAFIENISFQAKTFAGLWIKRGDVILAGAGNFEAGSHQGCGHAIAVADFIVRDAVEQPVVDDLARFAAPRRLDQADDFARPLRVERVGPAVLLVEHITQSVEGGLIARRRNVETAPAGQLHARRDKMQLDAAFVSVANPKNIALVRFEPSEGQPFESIHRLPLLAFGRRVLGCERQDPGAISPFVRRRVD